MYSCICCGRCCKNHILLLTFRDLREIHIAFPNLALEPMLTLHQLGQEYLHAEHMRHAVPIHLDIPGWPKSGYLGLKFLPYHKETICPFLDPATNHCQIYDHRPMLCRKYPYGTDETGTFLIQQVRCPGRERLALEAQEEICEIIESAWATFTEFRREVDQWNAQSAHKTIADFFVFIFKPGQ